MRQPRRFHVRTILPDGTIRLDHRLWQCRTPAAQFAGQRAAFGCYYQPGERRPYLLSLWGSEAMYRCNNPGGADFDALWPGPFCDNGVFRWEWWEAQP